MTAAKVVSFGAQAAWRFAPCLARRKKIGPREAARWEVFLRCRACYQHRPLLFAVALLASGVFLPALSMARLPHTSVACAF